MQKRKAEEVPRAIEEDAMDYILETSRTLEAIAARYNFSDLQYIFQMAVLAASVAEPEGQVNPQPGRQKLDA